MRVPSEFFEKELTAAEFKVAVALYQLADDRLHVDVLTSELSSMTGYSDESLRRAFRGLEEHGLLATTRTKRNFGKYSKNKYQLVLPSHKAVGWSESPSHKDVGSTGGHVVPVSSNNLTTTGTQLANKTYLRNTSYFLVRTGGAHMDERIIVPKWNPDEDEGLAGFGLFEEEIAAKSQPRGPRKNDPRTRMQRPEEQWTAADVAAEFSHQMWLRFPSSVALVNRQRLAGALRANRAKFGTTASIEMELLRMFFADDRNLKDAEKNPSRIHGWYLNTFKTQMPKAMERLGMEPTQRLLNSQLEISHSTSEPATVLTASDGEVFENSFAGRKELEYYEKTLRESS